jgi:uncharacterized Fe-S cluster-containing radical SAM superfamily enzyme
MKNVDLFTDNNFLHLMELVKKVEDIHKKITTSINDRNSKLSFLLNYDICEAYESAISKLDKIKLSINSLDFYNTISVDLDTISKDINLLESYTEYFIKALKKS